MRFTTLSFFIFFAVVYLLFWSLKGKSRYLILLPASIFFYAAWSPLFALHFLLVLALNYLVIIQYAKTKSRPLFFTALVGNFANLFLFKYFYLFLQFLFDVSGSPIFSREVFHGWLESVTGYGQITLPLAISFYTFQIVAFLVDLKRGQIEEIPSAPRYFLFILFFPQLVAGPIMRHTDFFYQLDSLKPTKDQLSAGVWLLLLGITKKILIADNMAPVIRDVFLSPDQYDVSSNIMAVVGYSVRVYGDFSGYTDMARGMGLLLGINLPINFSGPYLSRSLQELWRRWHISLSTWMRDYLYIPLGGSRGTEFRQGINNLITFTLGGLWHGAAYTYIAWGFIHGLGLVVERWFKKRFLKNVTLKNFPTLIRIPLIVLLTVYAFSFFSLGIVFFNAADMPRAIAMLGQIFGAGDGIHSSHNEQISYLFVLAMVFNAIEYRPIRWKLPFPLQMVLAAFFSLGLLILLGLFPPGGADFIYFQF